MLRFIDWEDHFELRALKGWCLPCERVLDIGYGTGHMDLLLAEQGYQMIGLEVDNYAYALASYFKSFQLKAIQDRFRIADVLPAPEEYDRVWMSHVVEHMSDSSIEAVFSALKRPTHVLVAVPLQGGFADKTDLHIWANREEFLHFCEGRMGPVAWCEEYPEGVIRAEIVL
jgi:2-polyprenyl-3-methyl-5-hydroxy-6-metoxy-1,4-benzoquinol methylase